MRGMTRFAFAALGVLSVASTCFAIGTTPDWGQYGGNAQHAAISMVPAQPLNQILWSHQIDLNRQYSGNSLLIHYGSPLISRRGTIILAVKTGATGTYRMEALTPAGLPMWTQNLDYVTPSSSWIPSCGSALVNGQNLVSPGAGGTILVHQAVDVKPSGNGTDASVVVPGIRTCFFGMPKYNAAKATYNANVKIACPLTVGLDGSIFFSFRTTGVTPVGLKSGFARQMTNGVGRWVSASNACNDVNCIPALNCAPALSPDGTVVYCAAFSTSNGRAYLLGLDSKTLQTKYKVGLVDPESGANAGIFDQGTSSPMVGPDGDVYYGFLQNPFWWNSGLSQARNNDRGWMVHFNSTLNVQKPTGSFGWDDTASIVPSWAVPQYLGASPYLLLTKYNNYASVGGDGANKLAVLDPNDTQLHIGADYHVGSDINVMKEVVTVTGPTPDDDFPGFPNAVREWCINTAAVDPIGHCAIVNSEDGKCYHWNFDTNTLDQVLTLTAGVGEAYTPTVIGPNGVSYAVNNGIVFAMGAGS